MIPGSPPLCRVLGKLEYPKERPGFTYQILSGLPRVPSSSTATRWSLHRGQKRSHTMSQNRECLDDCAACMLKGVSPGMGPCCRLTVLSLELWNWPQLPALPPRFLPDWDVPLWVVMLFRFRAVCVCAAEEVDSMPEQQQLQLRLKLQSQW